MLPAIQITFSVDTTDQSNAAQLLRSFQQADNTLEDIVIRGRQETTPVQWFLLVFSLVCLIFLFRLLHSFYRIKAIIRAHSVQIVDGVKFVNTSVEGTPFSYFHYIFWHKQIPLQSATGRQIFQHEMVHVEEKHTLDKLFLEVVLVFCWSNPFFWMMRKELHALHEFIADQKSVGRNDTAAFAAMILQSAYPKNYHLLINPFFENSIKRRIVMLTKMQNPSLSYISRIVALPMITATVLVFTARATDLPNIEKENASGNKNHVALLQAENKFSSDTLPKNGKEIRSVDVTKDPGKKISELAITYADGTSEKMTAEEAEKKGLINNSGYGNTTMSIEKALPQRGIRIREAGKGENQPLFFLDGKEISKGEMDKIDPNAIESVNVLKDKSATEKYGEKGKNGVVEITSIKDPKDRRLTYKLNDSTTVTMTASNIVLDLSGTATGTSEQISKGNKAKTIENGEKVEH
jgi:hypothetical protein